MRLFNLAVHISKTDTCIPICVRLKAPLCCTQVIYIQTGGEKNASGTPSSTGYYGLFLKMESRKLLS